MQRWYARDDSSSCTSSGAYAGCVAHLKLDMVAALAAAGSSHQLQLWSAEQPSLYSLLVRLTVGGQLLEVEAAQVHSQPGTQQQRCNRRCYWQSHNHDLSTCLSLWQDAQPAAVTMLPPLD